MDKHEFVKEPVQYYPSAYCQHDHCGLPPSADVHDVGESGTEKPLSRTLTEIQAEWRESVQAEFMSTTDMRLLELNVAILGNRLLLEANLSGEFDAYQRIAKK